jgi:hypothetical protein
MTDPNFISQEAGLNFNTVVEAIIKRSCIIDFGIVQDVVSDGIVDVAVAVSKTKQDMLCMTCVLANIASKAFTLNVKPHKGDRVLVVYPRLYDDKMFEYTDSENDNLKLIENYEAKGYNLASGIAILISQYRESGHKNVITIDEDSLEMEVNNGKTKMQIDNSGNVTVDTEGKYNIKNNSTTLFKVIDGLAKEVENLTTQGSPATQATSPTSKASIATWRSNKLNQLIEDD